MLTLLPIIFLLLAGGVLLVLRRLGRGIGSIWLTAVLATFLTWCGVLVLHWFPPAALTFPHWRLADASAVDAIVFSWDALAWPYALAFITFATAVLLTAPVRFGQGSTALSWAMVLIFSAAGLLGLIANSPLAVIFAWMALDIIELLFLLSNRSPGIFRRELLTNLAFRLGGSFMLVAAMAHAFTNGTALNFGTLSATEALLIFVAAFMRMGVLPMNLPELPEMETHRGLTSILRLASLLTALLPLAHFVPISPEPAWLPALTTLFVGGCYYGALMWLTAGNELIGRPYWFLATGGLALLAVLQGQAALSIVWGAVIVLGGGAVFLYSYRRRWLAVVPVISVFGLAGLPFSPTSPGWSAFPNTLGWNILIAGILILLLVGSLRHILRANPNPEGVENWGVASYVFGLALLILAQGLVGFFGLPERMQLGRWMVSVPVAILTGLILFGLRRADAQTLLAGDRGAWVRLVIERIGHWLGEILKMRWFYRILDGIYALVQRLVLLMERILEGVGGVLWALLLLTLLITVLAQGVRR